MPTVSIVMPVYNKADYLTATFDALISQSYEDWEMIVVNDGSTDGSADIIDKYAQMDGRIYCIKQNNRGVSAARNTGFSKALGEWIWFVDADDLPNKDFLKNVFSNKYDDTVAVIVGSYQRLEENGEIRGVQIEEQGFILSEDFPNLFMKYQYKTGFWGYLWNKLIKRDLLIEVQMKFQEGLTLAEDLKFMLGLYQQNINLYSIPYSAMRYTVDAINASKEKKIDYLAQLSIQIEIKEWIIDYCRKLEYTNHFRWIISRYAAFVVFYGYENNEDYIRMAKTMVENQKVNSQLCTKDVESVMRPIIWCLIGRNYFLLKVYLFVRTGIRKMYRRMHY